MKITSFFVCLCMSFSLFGQLDLDAPLKAQVITQDLVVQGSGCMGLDCVNGETFGFDTHRLKENNLRIHFFDTSVSASFPSNDWRILANDTNNGGTNHFSIEDATAGRTPFRVEAGARTDALVVEADGDIGIGTRNPTSDLQIATGDTPTIRLEQNGSNGFTPQTFDVAANEANFFVRDVTNGSAISFRIKPGSPENSISITDMGVGIKKRTPTSALDVEGDVTISGEFFAASDLRLKKEISSIENANNIINQLDGKKYFFDNTVNPSADLPEGLQFGLIAQEVEKVLETLVNKKHMAITDEAGQTEYLKGINYQELIPILINANKEQNALIEDLKANQIKMQKQIDALRSLLLEQSK